MARGANAQHRRRQDEDREHHEHAHLSHQVVVVDNLNLNDVHDVLDTAPDLDLLILLAHCSVGGDCDKCSGAGLVDDIAGGATAATSAVGSLGGAESQASGLDFEHLERQGASKSLVRRGVADPYLVDGVHPRIADYHGDVEDDSFVVVHKCLDDGHLVKGPIEEEQQVATGLGCVLRGLASTFRQDSDKIQTKFRHNSD